MGHTPEPGTCSGSVLNLSNCMDVTLRNVDLYGCGAYGINAYSSDYIYMEDSVIRDCTYGCLSMYNSYGLYFTNDTFRDCNGYNMLEFFNSTADFQDCTFDNLNGTFLYADEYAYVYFVRCAMDEDMKAAVEGLPGFGIQVFGDWESSSSVKG